VFFIKKTQKNIQPTFFYIGTPHPLYRKQPFKIVYRYTLIDPTAFYKPILFYNKAHTIYLSIGQQYNSTNQSTLKKRDSVLPSPISMFTFYNKANMLIFDFVLPEDY